MQMTQGLTLGEQSEKMHFKLRGVIYHGQNHFTCRYISKSRQVYYHDGVNGSQCVYDGVISHVLNEDDLYSTRGRRAILFFYSTF